jgi:hypothetical protein
VMQSTLSHIRRDHVREAPGVRVEVDNSGAPTRVIVEQP